MRKNKSCTFARNGVLNPAPFLSATDVGDTNFVGWGRCGVNPTAAHIRCFTQPQQSAGYSKVRDKYKNITLIGMAGVGKSVLGEKLAKKLGYKFLDIDEIIKKQIGLELQEIIDKFGEKRFLEVEEGIVLNLGHINNYVISPGGSIVYSKKAMLFLKKISKVIFLHASFETIKKRLLVVSTRGIIGLKEKSLKELYEERNPLYKKYADIIEEIPGNFDIANLFKRLVQTRD